MVETAAGSSTTQSSQRYAIGSRFKNSAIVMMFSHFGMLLTSWSKVDTCAIAFIKLVSIGKAPQLDGLLIAQLAPTSSHQLHATSYLTDYRGPIVREYKLIRFTSGDEKPCGRQGQVTSGH
ncbi:hypothetical protein T4A_11513 [Trichinella pseudospiralis]|uniref:Uncharacterized protein n=1 Tax=Trichinella pseudospiralis TaxID=6337 RepID=A0A0V1EHD7_TRIPS|nr:hypothetical protein T4A_11513 [Trichinella pseudospiralis]